MREPFIAAAPIVQPLRRRFGRTCAILSRLLPPPAYGPALSFRPSEADRARLGLFSAMTTAVPLSLLLWIGIHHLVKAAL